MPISKTATVTVNALYSAIDESNRIMADPNMSFEDKKKKLMLLYPVMTTFAGNHMGMKNTSPTAVEKELQRRKLIR